MRHLNKEKPQAMAAKAREGQQQRLQSILQGAFSGPPTPLKDIPKRNGESRQLKGASKPSKRRVRRSSFSSDASAKTSVPRS
jgi:hypothetical protein